MKINISFAELSAFIKAKTGQTITFSQGKENVICVGYEQNILIRTITIPVDITIMSVEPERVRVMYNGGIGIDLIITGLLSFLKNAVPNFFKGISVEEKHCIGIDLSNIPQTKDAIEHVALQKIRILSDSIEVTATLK